MREASDWQPGCSVLMLQQRARLMHCVRSFFTEQGYLEVTTPLLSQDIVIDAHLQPLATELNGKTMYLQTSPEAAMKRLLAAGSGSIFQITPAFRGDEQGKLHNPEFTMLEWYGVETSWQEQLVLTESLVRAGRDAVSESQTNRLPPDRFSVTTYQEAFRRRLGINVLEATTDQLRKCAAQLAVSASLPRQRDALLNLLLATAVEPTLGSSGPEFLVDYPASQAALAELSKEDPRVAHRFELYMNGVEICNGYQELLDPGELRQRESVQQEERLQAGGPSLPGARRLLSAMEAGLPRCSGVALGLDRLLFTLTGVASIQECLPFSVERA